MIAGDEPFENPQTERNIADLGINPATLSEMPKISASPEPRIEAFEETSHWQMCIRALASSG